MVPPFRSKTEHARALIQPSQNRDSPFCASELRLDVGYARKMSFPTEMRTQRLYLRRPRPADVPAIFTRYAANPEVTRYLGWPRHQSVQQTQAFLESSDRFPTFPRLNRATFFATPWCDDSLVSRGRVGGRR
jgi:RimJ/RimL family protein N-acetyltransferase